MPRSASVVMVPLAIGGVSPCIRPARLGPIRCLSFAMEEVEEVEDEDKRYKRYKILDLSTSTPPSSL